MESDSSRDITGLLRAWSDGDQAALESLIPFVEGELRRIAKSYLERERPNHLLQTTALVNEAYVRLIDIRNVSWRDRVHFFATAARIMRHILVDYSRAAHTAKRGRGAKPITLADALVVSRERTADVVAIDEALSALAKMDARKGQVVELRFFGGLSVEETAEVLSVSRETVLRDWRLAKIWLMRELSREGTHGPGAMATS